MFLQLFYKLLLFIQLLLENITDLVLKISSALILDASAFATFLDFFEPWSSLGFLDIFSLVVESISHSFILSKSISKFKSWSQILFNCWRSSIYTNTYALYCSLFIWRSYQITSVSLCHNICLLSISHGQTHQQKLYHGRLRE